MLNFSLVVSFATILTLLTTAATGRVTRMPVEVAQDGTIVHYLYDPEHDDIAASVINFCQTHLPSMNIEECSKSLLNQVQKFKQGKIRCVLHMSGEMTLPSKQHLFVIYTFPSLHLLCASTKCWKTWRELCRKLSILTARVRDEGVLFSVHVIRRKREAYATMKLAWTKKHIWQILVFFCVVFCPFCSFPSPWAEPALGAWKIQHILLLTGKCWV